MSQHNGLGEPELETNRADFILKKGPQWLNQFELQVVGEAADIVVRLNLLGGLRLFGG